MFYYGINYCKLLLQMAKLLVRLLQTGGNFVIISCALIFVQESLALRSLNKVLVRSFSLFILYYRYHFNLLIFQIDCRIDLTLQLFSIL